MKFNKETASKYTDLLRDIRGREQKINACAAMAIPAVHSGDNVSYINRLIAAAFKTKAGNWSKDADAAVRLFARFTGHKFDKQNRVLTGLKSRAAKDASAKAWAEFKESGASILDAINAQSKPKKELTAEQQQERDIKAVKTAIAKALEHGVKLDDLMAVVSEVAGPQLKAA